MDAPTANYPKPTLDDINESKEYIIDLEKFKFNVQIGKINKNSIIFFQINELNSFSNVFYESYYSLDDLKKISKLFRIFDTIDEAYNEFNEIFKNKKLNIEKELNGIILQLNLTNLSSKIENISLKIEKKNLSIEKSYEKICNELEEIKKNIQNNQALIKRIELLEQNLKEENQKNIQNNQRIELLEQNLKEENQKNIELKQKVDEIINEKNQLKNIINELVKENQNQKKILNELLIMKESNVNKLKEKEYNIESKIIKKKEEIELLINRLKYKKKNKLIQFNLIYRASIDGDSPNNYHYNCDGKKNTLCVIETKKGCKFGGYTETTIKSGNGIDDKDPNAFVFSLNKMKIYENMKKDKNAVCHSKGWGPIFRSDSFAVWDQKFFFYNEHKVGTKSSSNFGVFDIDYELNNGEQYFSIQELEVFEICFE